MPDSIVRRIDATLSGARSSLAGAGRGLAVRLAALAGIADGRRAEAADTGALALVDIDDFKRINTREGFDIGDRLLDAIGDVLHRALPPQGTLERMESGRFLVWMPPALRGEARAQTERLRMLAAQAIVEGVSGPVSCNLSAGTVSAGPGENRARTILRADAALSKAKRMGGGRTETGRALPSPSLVPARADVEAAIAKQALEYHVQPIVRLADDRPVGVEALIRWTRADGGVLGPAGFLDTLNRIPEAGSDLFPDMAVQAARPFLAAPDPLFITFNVTGAVLDGTNDPGARWLAEVTDRLPCDRLVFEIVETAVIVQNQHASALIDRLRRRGVRFALDDFGTGLSNLERLRQFPVDILKLDRAFVGNMGRDGREEAILSAVVALARGLDVDLVAEGIETAAQATRLLDLGVTLGQGYHFGRPAAAAEWAARLARGPGRD